mgnify:FL=1
MKNFMFDFGKSLILSILLTFIALLLLSAVLNFTDVSENIISPSIIVISSVCIMIGSFIVSKKIKEKGILNGAILGILYMFVLYIISTIANGSFALNVSSLAMIGIGIIAGIFGGILGVNLNNK